MWDKIGKIAINIFIIYFAIVTVVFAWVLVGVFAPLSLGWMFILVIFITKIITFFHVAMIDSLTVTPVTNSSRSKQ
jgi:hypothetical protein